MKLILEQIHPNSNSPELCNEKRAKDVQETWADTTLSTETIVISKEDAENGDIESHLTNTGIQLRLAGSERADVEADEDRELLEKEINVKYRESGKFSPSPYTLR